MQIVLSVEQLFKKYKDRYAVNGISFQVRAGTCFGLLGPNGAGKSTIMKMISGIIQADQGKISLMDATEALHRGAIGKYVGYVPQDITLYEQLSAYQNLEFFGTMYGQRGNELKERIETVLNQVGLSDRAGDPIATYSGGMKRRINIAAALLHKPKLVVLDEPTVGIDPQSRNHIFELIRKMKREGTTIIYSTHYMEEAEALCDELAIIDHGKVIASGSVNDVMGRHARPVVYVEADGWNEQMLLSSASNVQVQAQGNGWLIESENALQLIHDLSDHFLQSGQRVQALELQQPSLETVFLKLTGTELRDV